MGFLNTSGATRHAAGPAALQAILLEAASHHDPTVGGVILDRECNGDSELRQRIERFRRPTTDSVISSTSSSEARLTG